MAEVRGQSLADMLSAETGLSYEVVAPETHAAALAAACEEGDRTIAFVTAPEYVLAHDDCGLQSSFVGLRDGITWDAGMIMLRSAENFDDAINNLNDLNGKSWGTPSQLNFTDYLYFRALFAENGIQVGETVEYGTDASAVIAGFNREVDFVTASYTPPILPFDREQWVYGDDPELWREAGQPYRSGIGFVVVLGYVEAGGWRVRDARAAALDSEPTIFQFTDILQLSSQIPNDAVAFGSEMPLGMVRQIEATLQLFSATEACSGSLCSADFFNWEGVAPVENGFYDSVRFVIGELSLTDDEVFTYLQP